MVGWFAHSKKFFENDDHGLDQIGNIGYGSYNPILNLGTLGIFLLLYFVKILGLIPIKCFNILTLGIGRNFFTKTFNALFWGEFIFIFINGYIEILISSILAYKAPKGSPDNTDFFFGFAMFLLYIALILIPSLLLWIVIF